MATVKAATTDVSIDGSVQKVIWTPLTNTNQDGGPAQGIEFADRCVQVTGTFGGATITIQGSNDGTNWDTLNNAQGTAATFTAQGTKQLVEVPQFVRPLLSGGSGSSLTVTMIARRSNSLRN
jgi:hypothetical protein